MAKRQNIRAAEVKILSDGFERIASAALRSAHLSIPFFANKLGAALAIT
jgi:hypothetical protein